MMRHVVTTVSAAAAMLLSLSVVGNATAATAKKAVKNPVAAHKKADKKAPKAEKKPTTANEADQKAVDTKKADKKAPKADTATANEADKKAPKADNKPPAPNATFPPAGTPAGPPPPLGLPGNQQSAAYRFGGTRQIPPPAPHPAGKPYVRPQQPAPVPRHDHPLSFWQISLAARSGWVTDGGYDPFSENNMLTYSELSASRTMLLIGRASLAAGLTFGGASSTSTARGADTELKAFRLGLVVEGRYHLSHYLYGFARLEPDALREKAVVKEPSAQTDLEQSSWQFAMDTSVGVAWAPLEMLKVGSGDFGLWLFGAAGYGLVTKTDLTLETTGDRDDPQQTSNLSFGQLSLGGPMLRFGVAGTY